MSRSPENVVAVSVSSFGAEDEAPLELLREAGARVVPNPHGRKLSEAEAAELLSDADGVIAGTEPLTADVIAGAPRLRVISRVGAGLENVDLDAAEQRGVAVRNTPEAVTDAVAELTLAGILAVLRKVPAMDSELRTGEWRRQMGGLLKGRTVGIVGCGRVGRRVAELLAPFGANVIACDPAPDSAAVSATGAELVEPEALFAAADIVTLHASGGASPLIGAEQLAKMKPGAILANAARGDLVDENALVQALEEGRLGGAYLDTFSEEPYEGPLRGLANVVLTPHAGSYAREARIQMETEAVQNLLAALDEAPA